ncbi:MAG: hypothetical protein AAF348_07835 [Bacteroidota bacterium]
MLAIILLTPAPLIGIGQEFKSNVFLRTPQVVNYNFNQNEISYSPVISIGTGLSHKSKFIELATFISNNDIYGLYTFFGTTLKTKELNGNWKLLTNWFGEVTYVPKQALDSNTFTYTTGLCFFLNYSFDWGSIGIPLCVGAAYGQNTISLNTRTIFNISLLLN